MGKLYAKGGANLFLVVIVVVTVIVFVVSNGNNIALVVHTMTKVH